MQVGEHFIPDPKIFYTLAPGTKGSVPAHTVLWLAPSGKSDAPAGTLIHFLATKDDEVTDLMRSVFVQEGMMELQRSLAAGVETLEMGGMYFTRAGARYLISAERVALPEAADLARLREFAVEFAQQESTSSYIPPPRYPRFEERGPWGMSNHKRFDFR